LVAGELGRSRRYLVLGICCMSLFIVGLDTTILNVGLPSLKHDLHAPDSGLQWTIDAYGLVIASLLLFSGSMGDRFGRRRVFRIGLTLFSAGSLLCSLAPGLGWLIVFRMVQAIGGSMLNPVAMAIITNTFTDRRERARAIGVWGAVIGLSMALGPVLGGVLVDGVSWRAIFWINVPIGLAAMVLTGRYVPESKAPRARRFDPMGQVLVAATLGTLTYAIIEAPSAGWTSTRTVVMFVLAAAALAGLVVVESRRHEALLDMRFFRSAPFSGATAVAVCAFAVLGGFLFLNTLYLQNVRGYSALHAGLLTLPMAAFAAIMPPISGRLVGGYGPRPSLVAAGVALPASGLLLTFLGPHTSLMLVIAAYGVRHAGRPGRGGGGGRLDQPAGRERARCRHLRLGRGAPGRRRRRPGGDRPDQLGRLVDHGRLWSGHRRARPRDHRILGSRHREPDRGTLRDSGAAAGTGRGPDRHRGGAAGVVTAGTPVRASDRPAETVTMDGMTVPVVAASSVVAASDLDQAAPPDDVAARVWCRMRELVLDRNERRREVCEALDLSFIRVKALLKLRPGPRTMRELAGALVIDRPYATVVVDELERRGLVERTVHPSDRRCRQVALTLAGEEAAHRADQILSDPPAALAGLPAADLEALDRLTAALETW
jgi:EmrB/QacA subfamily drug resistance transporter